MADYKIKLAALLELTWDELFVKIYQHIDRVKYFHSHCNYLLNDRIPPDVAYPENEYI